MVIESFGNQGTEDIWVGEDTKEARKVLPVDLWERARRLLDQLNAATSLGDMRLPLSNRLHSLKAKLAGYHSISINMKYRIIFRFADGKATKVTIVDYH